MPKNTTQSNTAGSLRSPALQIPKLRFPGFKGVWEEKKLEKILKVIDGDRGLNYPSSTDFYTAGYCLFLNAKNVTKNGFAFEDISFITKEKDENLRKGKLERNDIVLTTRGSIGHIAFYNEEVPFENIRINSGMVLLRGDKNITNSNFIFRFLNSKKVQNAIQRIAFGSAQPQLTVKEINNLKISFPQLPEQQKIASFLGSVDEWLENLRTQKQNLEQYKKGIMQQIFSQKIRFTDENGNDFPDWEEKRLGEIAEIYQPQTISQSDLSEESSYDVWGANGIIGKYNKYNHEQEQVIVTCRGSTCGTINFTKPFSWITGNAMVINVDNKDVSKLFIFYYLQNDNLKYLISGSGQPQITGNIKLHKVVFPLFQEQQKIAEFLSSVDELIEFKQQQITQAEGWKKGVMQGLFV